MGTVFSLVFAEPVTADLLAAVDGELRRTDRVFSPWRRDSEVSRLGRGELRLGDCTPEVVEVFSRCADAEAETRGYFTARFRGGLDPTGLVKGWAVERVSRLLSDAGSTAHVVNGGGDVLALGPPGHAWRIGVVDPRASGALLGVVAASSITVATSGNAERPGEIVDPFTRRPALDVLAVTVACADLVRADAAATAAVAMGRDCRGWLAEAPDLEALVVAADGAVWVTAGFADLMVDQRSESRADCSDRR
jgi:thiamine biosynthesis lipoprotein